MTRGNISTFHLFLLGDKVEARIVHLEHRCLGSGLMFYSRLRELLVAAGGGQWVVHFYCGKEHLHVRRCQILILPIYQGIPPQLSQLNRQDFARIIQSDDRSISLIINNRLYSTS